MRLIGWRKVADKIDHQRSWIFQAVREGRFPPPIDAPDLPGKALWSEQAVDAWIAERIAGAQARAETKASTAPDSRPAV